MAVSSNVEGGEEGGGAPLLFDLNTFKVYTTRGANLFCSDDLKTFPVYNH